MIKIFKSLKPFEWAIWIISAMCIIASFFIFRNDKYHYLVVALIGITALVFVSKGIPLGQILTIVFSVFYGIAAYSFKYYGEMITYLGMSSPMALAALISWIRNPFRKGNSEVKINSISGKEWILFVCLSALVTTAFYFILQAIGTANVLISTVSVFTSFAASYLTLRRSKFYALAYALNDIVLIVMWIMACLKDIEYLPMVVCFTSFLVLDVYGFINWNSMHKKQNDIRSDN